MAMVDASPADSGRGVDSGGPADDGGGGGLDSPLADSGFDAGSTCSYPTGPVEPMERDEVIWPYSWPSAIDGMGNDFPLDLTEVFCTADPNIDWSPFDVLVFIAIPAW
jgi:hypothetical protein